MQGFSDALHRPKTFLKKVITTTPYVGLQQRIPGLVAGVGFFKKMELGTATFLSI
jgi:hypothetical protein